eukprot:SAG31_NODE_6788_length_1888_cov_1.050307_2_plen_364_part_00
MEVPGEDPLTTGEYGALFVKAVQGRSGDGKTIRVVCAPKHWLDYDLEGRHDKASPDWGPSRNDFDARVSRQEQMEYFLPQWHATMTYGKPGAVMCSTNRYASAAATTASPPIKQVSRAFHTLHDSRPAQPPLPAVRTHCGIHCLCVRTINPRAHAAHIYIGCTCPPAMLANPSGSCCGCGALARVNGVDSCMNPTYLEGFLRQRFNFTGYVVTDGGSCGNPNCRATVALKNSSAAESWSEVGHEIAAELCVSAGTDIELGTTLSEYTANAIAAKRIPADDVIRSNVRLYSQMIAQGHLETVPDDHLDRTAVDTAFARDVAFEVRIIEIVRSCNVLRKPPFHSDYALPMRTDQGGYTGDGASQK